MESQNYILQNIAELLIDESLNVRKQAEHTCLSCTDNERNLLIDQILSVFKSNWLKKTLQCSFIAETLMEMNKKEFFAPSQVKNCFNLLLADVFSKYSKNADNENTNDQNQQQGNDLFIKSCILFGQSFALNIEGLELFFSILFESQNDNLLCNTYSLILLQKSINVAEFGIDLTNLLKKYYDSFIHSFSMTLSSNNNLNNTELTKLYENVVFSLDQIFKVLSQSKFHITSQEESNINTSLENILKSIYDKLSDDGFDSNFRMRVFDLSITSLIFLSHDTFLSNIHAISDSIIKFILLPDDSKDSVDKTSALILLALYHQLQMKFNDNDDHILKSCKKADISKIANVMLDLLSDNDQLSKMMKHGHMKAFLSISSYIEKLCPNSIIDPALKSLKKLKETFETKNVSSLLILSKLVEDKLASSSQQVKEICNILNELCNKSKINSNIEAVIYLFMLWISLSHHKIIPAETLKTSDIFRVISSPCIASKTIQNSLVIDILTSISKDDSEITGLKSDSIVNTYDIIKNNDEVFAFDVFNELLLQVAKTSKIPELLNTALDPKYILAAPIAFSCMSAADEDPDYSSDSAISKVLIPRALIYSSCPFFTIKTRSDIVCVIGRISPLSRDLANKAQNDIIAKNCRACCQRIVNQFIHDLVEQQESPSEIPPLWIQSSLTFLDLFQKSQHPDAGKKDPAFPISFIKAGIYCVVAILFTFVKNTIGSSNTKPNTQDQKSGLSFPTIADGRPLTLSSLFQPLFTKCNIGDPIESVAMATALESLYGYNKPFAMDSFKAKSENRKFAPKDPGHIFILEFCSRMLSINNSYESKVKEMLDDDSLPSDVRSRSLRRLLKKGKSGISSIKANLLINDTLESTDEETVKLGLSVFLLLLKKNQIQNYQDVLAKAVNAFYSFPNLSELSNQIFTLTPIDLNFQNFCTKIFGANSIESANYITNLIETMNSQEQESNDKKIQSLLKNSTSAAAVTLMFLNPDYFENAKKLANIIFSFKNSAEEFPLTFYCSSEPQVSEEFVLKLFNGLKYYDPWNELAIKAILYIAKDPRFDKVIPSCTEEFMKMIGYIARSSISNVSKKIASILYEKDKFNFVNKLLLNKPLTTNNQFATISEMIDSIGPTIFAIAMKHKIEQPLYSNVLSIIRQTKMPDNIQLSSIVFIIFTISQILSILSDSSRSKDLKKSDFVCLFDDCLKSLKNLSNKYPLIESPRVQKILNQTKESISNGAQSDLDDEEKYFNLIRSLFSVCPNEITIFHITFFTDVSPIGAIAGYTEMIHQGRSLLNEILLIGQKAKKAALFAIPNLKLLSTERYGEAQLGQLFDFILDNLSVAPAEGFNCILQLFDWLPKNVLFDKCDKMFINTQKVIRKIGAAPQQPQTANSNVGKARPAQVPSSSLLSSHTLNQTQQQSQQPQQSQNDNSTPSNNPNYIYKFNIYDIINGLNCMTRYSDSLTFSSRPEFKNNIPYYLAYSYCYSSIDVITNAKPSSNSISNTIAKKMKKSEPFIVPAARKALLTLCQFAGMSQTAQLIQKNFTIDDEKIIDGEKVIIKNRFLIEISKSFVEEMDIRCLDAAFTLLDEEQRNVDIKIAASFLLCAAMHEKKGLERNVHLRLVPILATTNDEKLKMGILRALKSFPISL